MTYQERVQQDRRLGILQFLEAARPIGLRVALLADVLRDSGRHLSLDTLHTDLAWLQEQGLVLRTEDVAQVTARGQDAALGHARVPGVRIPD